MSEFATPSKVVAPVQQQVQQGRSLAPPPFQLKTEEKEGHGPEIETKDNSARFDGDNALKKIMGGTETIKKGASGIKVVKLQQALIDMGYKLPIFGVDGDFGDETVAALKLFQHDAKIAETGVFDQATIQTLDKRFDTRKDYLEAAADFDSKDPTKSTRTLTADQRKAAVNALKPQPSAAGAKFDPKDSSKYAAAIKVALGGVISHLHKELYEDKVDLRKDPAKNFHKDSNLQGAANAGKEVTDKVYGDLAKGPEFKMGVNLIDQWDDEEKIDAGMSPAAKKTKAKGKVEYLIDANCVAVNKKFNATPSDAVEAKALAPVIASFIDTSPKVQIMLDLETGWEGAQLNGIQYLQRFKDSSKEANRKRLWTLFHVSIHEYIHTLAHADYNAWAEKLGGAKQHTLVEGFCDFYTMNVRAKFPASTLKSLKAKVEGDFFDAKKDIPGVNDLDVGVYSSNAEAERMVGIVGINNAQLGYFQGKTKLMGDA